MSSHRINPHRRTRGRPQPVPNWLKVFYVLVIFMSYVIALSLVLHK